MAQVLDRPAVRASTLLGMAVMDAIDAGSHSGSIMLHDMPREVRSAIIDRLLAAGWTATEGNAGMRGAKDPESGAYIAMWLPEADRCPECHGSGVDSVDRGELCPLCKGRG